MGNVMAYEGRIRLVGFHYNPETKEISGDLSFMTEEECAALDEYCKAHPEAVTHPVDWDYRHGLREQQRKHGFGWGLRKLMEDLKNSEKKN